MAINRYKNSHQLSRIRCATQLMTNNRSGYSHLMSIKDLCFLVDDYPLCGTTHLMS